MSASVVSFGTRTAKREKLSAGTLFGLTVTWAPAAGDGEQCAGEHEQEQGLLHQWGSFLIGTETVAAAASNSPRRASTRSCQSPARASWAPWTMKWPGPARCAFRRSGPISRLASVAETEASSTSVGCPDRLVR